MANRTKIDRAAIEQCALDLVVREGAAALTVRRLGTVLGVAPTALYRHFPTIEAVRAALGAHAAERILQAIEEELAQSPETGGRRKIARRKLRRAVKAIVHFALAEPALYGLFATTAGVSTDDGAGSSRVREQLLVLLTPLVASADAARCADSLLALLHGIALLNRTRGLGDTTPSGLARFALDGFLRGWDDRSRR